MNKIEDNIKLIWQQIDDWLNKDIKLISSEKSVVFNFAWAFFKKFEKEITIIDFETSLFKDFSDGQFLDLLINFKHDDKVVRIGFEFKYPNKKKNGSNHTETRQKIINDIKRLNWLVENDKIDMGCFLCLTNEKNYIHKANLTKAANFLTHQGQTYKANEFLPDNEKYREKVKSLTDIKFNWKYASLKKNKYCIDDSKVSFLEPIFISKESPNR
jgi:hypothetical protein